MFHLESANNWRSHRRWCWEYSARTFLPSLVQRVMFLWMECKAPGLLHRSSSISRCSHHRVSLTTAWNIDFSVGFFFFWKTWDVCRWFHKSLSVLVIQGRRLVWAWGTEKIVLQFIVPSETDCCFLSLCLSLMKAESMVRHLRRFTCPGTSSCYSMTFPSACYGTRCCDRYVEGLYSSSAFFICVMFNRLSLRTSGSSFTFIMIAWFFVNETCCSH